ncbi:hypothetical protein J2127_001590 [Methanococcus voltae]|uniref:hypothetical protein n=1 Tax=Methanococcus voltae TaxID=2188 RepID=UPI001AE1087F|nr:hypothetical protein [Methanococcus voltae]MBP2144407.1 hypothetical protein [Methanococcus voltae]
MNIKKLAMLLMVIGSLFTVPVFATSENSSSEDIKPVLISAEIDETESNNEYTLSNLLADIWNKILNFFGFNTEDTDDNNDNTDNSNNVDNINNSNNITDENKTTELEDNYTYGKIIEILEEDEHGTYKIKINTSENTILFIGVTNETEIITTSGEIEEGSAIKVQGDIMLMSYPGILIANSVEVIKEYELPSYTYGTIVNISEKDENGVYDIKINTSANTPLFIRVGPETKVLCNEEDIKAGSVLKVEGKIMLRSYPGILIANSIDIVDSLPN